MTFVKIIAVPSFALFALCTLGTKVCDFQLSVFLFLFLLFLFCDYPFLLLYLSLVINIKVLIFHVLIDIFFVFFGSDFFPLWFFITVGIGCTSFHFVCLSLSCLSPLLKGLSVTFLLLIYLFSFLKLFNLCCIISFFFYPVCISLSVPKISFNASFIFLVDLTKYFSGLCFISAPAFPSETYDLSGDCVW